MAATKKRTTGTGKSSTARRGTKASPDKTAGATARARTTEKAAPKRASAKTAQKEAPPPSDRMSDAIRGEVVVIAVFAFAVLLAIGIFTEAGGALGVLVHRLFFGLFGVGAVILPFALMLGCIFAGLRKFRASSRLKNALMGVLFVAFISIFHIRYINGNTVATAGVAEYLGYFVQNGGTDNGGLLGAMVGGSLKKILGTVGSYVVFGAIVLISAVTITERSIFEVISNAASKTADTARKINEKRKEMGPVFPRAMEVAKPRPQTLDIKIKEPETSIDKIRQKIEGKGESYNHKLTWKEKEAFEALSFAEQAKLVEAEPEKYGFAAETPELRERKIRKPMFDEEDTYTLDDMHSEIKSGISASGAAEELIPLSKTFGRAPSFAKAKDADAEDYGAHINIAGDVDEDAPTLLGGLAGDAIPMEVPLAIDDRPPFDLDDTPMGGEAAVEPMAEPLVEPLAEPLVEPMVEPAAEQSEALLRESADAPAAGMPDEMPTDKPADMPTGDAEEIEIHDYVKEDAAPAPGAAANPFAALAAQEDEEEEAKGMKNEFIDYQFPPIDLLQAGKSAIGRETKDEMLRNAQKLEETLRSFGVRARVVQINRGPTVTRYELTPEQGVKVSKIVNLADDIALSFAASGIRIEAPIPGKSAIGIEVPNREQTPVFLREILESTEFQSFSSKTAFGVGKDIGGSVIIADIAKMPHLLIAGATGAGKSVCINTLITSILYKASPNEVKLILIDPKVVELSIYNGIPHLLIPVVTDPKKAAGALNWAVKQMLERYQLFSEENVRNLKAYNNAMTEKLEFESILPNIVIIIDELSDLMMAAPKEVEDAIMRLAQMARAAGIHLIIATQRPSVDVITGVIKANIPSRLAFAVSSGVDSKTILDMVGAERLIGKGDMLFSPSGVPKPMRVQGAFISDKEVENIVNFVKREKATEYDEKIVEEITSASKIAAGGGGDEGDEEFFEEAVESVVEKQKASVSMLQRQFRIGYNRAARLMETLENKGVVGPEEGSKPRKVLLTKMEYEAMKEGRR